MTTTDIIRGIREEQNLTQEAIAELLNTTRSNYAYLENRGDKLTIEQVKQIASVLNRPLGDILGITNSTNEVDLPKQVEELELRNRELETENRELKDNYKVLQNTLSTFNALFSLLKGEVMNKETEITNAINNDQTTKDVFTAIGNSILNNLDSNKDSE